MYMQKRFFIINVFIMTGSMLVIRIAGMISNIYIASAAGAEAMGLYQVIFAVYSFAVTLSVSGMSLCATRLVSESGANETGIMKRCFLAAAVMSFVSAALLFFGADSVARMSGDMRCAPALRVLSLTLPPIAASAVIRGFMIAKRRAAIITASQITEEFSAIAVSLLLLRKFSHTPQAYMCMIAGCFVSETAAFVFDISAYTIIGKDTCRSKNSDNLWKRIFEISVPVALGSYLRAGLVALENMLVPLNLARTGTQNALGEYGEVKSMAMQILLFPAAFIQSFSSMLVPEMSEMLSVSRKNGIRYVSSLSVQYTLAFAIGAAALFWGYHDSIAGAMYSERDAGVYLGYLAFLAVPMYLDTVVDSILKGLNQQMSNLRYNITDSILRVAAIIIFLPKFGILAYIAILYVSELFNLTLSYHRLAVVSCVRVNPWRAVAVPSLCAFAALKVAQTVGFRFFVSEMIFFCVIYTVLCTLVTGGYKRYRSPNR